MPSLGKGHGSSRVAKGSPAKSPPLTTWPPLPLLTPPRLPWGSLLGPVLGPVLGPLWSQECTTPREKQPPSTLGLRTGHHLSRGLALVRVLVLVLLPVLRLQLGLGLVQTGWMHRGTRPVQAI